MGRYIYLVIDLVALLAGFTLAFGAMTIIWRRHWVSFGPTESLLARLAASAVLAMVALAGVVQFLFTAVGYLQPGGADSSVLEPTQGRNPALAVIAAALALSGIAVLRIELYHRGVAGISRQHSEEEWEAEEEPQKPRVPRERF